MLKVYLIIDLRKLEKIIKQLTPSVKGNIFNDKFLKFAPDDIKEIVINVIFRCCYIGCNNIHNLDNVIINFIEEDAKVVIERMKS